MAESSGNEDNVNASVDQLAGVGVSQRLVEIVLSFYRVESSGKALDDGKAGYAAVGVPIRLAVASSYLNFLTEKVRVFPEFAPGFLDQDF